MFSQLLKHLYFLVYFVVKRYVSILLSAFCF